ncbi:ANK_REP_REGION domain-containing protein [Durusdinium trenchii]|uniref:ANK_REP_REGION domain-containing protein n=2 Tax=Durusdinium trenchii TaxID=1381693 RepID=A0ABP0SGJ2_9DINO
MRQITWSRASGKGRKKLEHLRRSKQTGEVPTSTATWGDSCGTRAHPAPVTQGDAVRAAILIETWGSSMDPLQRPELQILLEEAARRAPELLPCLANELEQRGVSLDWSVTNDCRANFGRYALDSALEVLVKETRNEQVALSLLSIGQGSGQGDTSQLDADPLMRAAAAQGMTRLVERLVKDCGASVNSKDPRFGSTALDRAVDAGKEQTALKLLQLGADPFAGRGVGYILARAGPEVRAQLPTTSVAREEVPTDLSEADFEQLRQRLPKISERMVLQELQSKRLSKVQLAQLLQEAARLGFRPRLLEHLCEGLERQQVPLNWDQASVLDAAFARRPLDAALETAVEENPDARAAVWLLDEGIKNSNGRKSRLNANPLLRTAASRCQVPLIERLVEINADPNAPDPRYGSTALDRAVSAGCTGAALTLLSLGADPDAGHGALADGTIQTVKETLSLKEEATNRPWL